MEPKLLNHGHEISEREANLLARFGFQWAWGVYSLAVSHRQIKKIEPIKGGMRVHYRDTEPLLFSEARVVLVDIPSGNFTTGDSKNLETAWIFVYANLIEDIDRSECRTIRSLQPR